MSFEARAPGEKFDLKEESLSGHIYPNELEYCNSNIEHNETPFLNKPTRFNTMSTAHISSERSDFLRDQNGRLAYDELVAECTAFLASPIVNETVASFAENIIAIIGSPTTLDSAEVKRRIEQILPTAQEYRFHRGMHISDKDCTILCSLADCVVNSTPMGVPYNVTIVDEEEEGETDHSPASYNRRTSVHNNYNDSNDIDVQYIRQQTNKSSSNKQRLPEQLPSFVEANFETDEGENIKYDTSVTPFDSDNDEPIHMTL